MTIDDLKPHELEKLWQWVSAEAHLHMDDAGPKTLDEFKVHLALNEITSIAVRTGKKLIGVIGFQPSTGFLHLHFAKEVRGIGIAEDSVRAVLHMLFQHGAEKVSVQYFAHNPYLPKFLAKLGGVIADESGKAIQAGKEVALRLVHFHGANGTVTPHK